MDVHLTDKLKKELSGIFNWALDGYKRLRENKFIFSDGISMQKAKQDYKSQSNSVFAFFSKNLNSTGNDDNGVLFKDTYSRYESFCRSEDDKDIFSKSDFKKTLKSAGYKIDNSSKHSNAVCIFGVEFQDTVVL